MPEGTHPFSAVPLSCLHTGSSPSPLLRLDESNRKFGFDSFRLVVNDSKAELPLFNGTLECLSHADVGVLYLRDLDIPTFIGFDAHTNPAAVERSICGVTTLSNG
jgi:hypothetical protein